MTLPDYLYANVGKNSWWRQRVARGEAVFAALLFALLYLSLLMDASLFGSLGFAFGPVVFGLGGASGGGGNSGPAGSPTSGTMTGVGKSTAGYTGGFAKSGTYSMSQANFNSSVTAAGGSITSSSYGSYSHASFGNGSTASWSGSGSGRSSSGRTGSSTPFLKTWNGVRFEHENDFLFGKPQTAFDDYASGIAAYQLGLGGDTYVLQNNVVAEGDTIKMRIHEIEPEESYLDSLALAAVDLQTGEHLVADGNLRGLYVFDTNKTTTVSTADVQHVSQRGDMHPATLAYSSLQSTTPGPETTLKTGDELVLKVPRASLTNQTDDLYILVDSHYRDWTLGAEVPFTNLEQFSIQLATLGRRVATTTAGVAVLAAGYVGISHTKLDEVVQKALVAQPAHADYQQGREHSHGGGQQGSGGYGYGNRSLLVFAQAGDQLTHLETIFPRYVQASQEVVKVPKEIINHLTDEYLILRIRATKKHIVRAAFAFLATARVPKAQPLTLTSAYHQREQRDYATDLSTKNNTFLRTEPADVVDLAFATPAPAPAGTTRRYLLTANGFYTKLSQATKKKLGTSWYHKLDRDDRRLLTRLKKNA
jgi:hypothetical protein